MLYFNQEGDLVAGFRNIWGDWAMHLSLTNAFAYQPVIQVIQNHPLYSGIPLSYPFFVDLISGLLVKIGINIIPAMIIPSIIYSWILLLGLFILGKTITGSSKQTLIAITLFITSGGLGFLEWINDLVEDFNQSNLLFPPQEYTHMKDIGYWWTNTLTAHLIPQRAFLLGMAIGVFLLAYLIHQFIHQFKLATYSKMLLLGLITGLLVYIHIHTLIFIFFFSFFLLLFSTKHIRYWLSFAFGTAVTSLTFIYFLSSEEIHHVFTFLPGWLSHSTELNMPFWLFWFKNWGFMLPLAIISLCTLLLFKTDNQRNIINKGEVVKKNTYNSQFPIPNSQLIIYSAFFFIFIVANLIKFQPSTWDNAKLFLWVYLGFSYLVAGLLIKIWQKNSFTKGISFALFILLIWAGTLDLIRILHTNRISYTMVNTQEIQLAEFIKQKTSPDSLFLTSDNHLHWLPLYSGRSIVLGYHGWIWSHGIDYEKKERDIRRIFQGQETSIQLIKQYKIDYVILDKKTKSNYNSNETFFNKNFKKIIESPEYKVFKI